jgi:hypothetical protein
MKFTYPRFLIEDGDIFLRPVYLVLTEKVKKFRMISVSTETRGNTVREEKT